ncbi:MULTISPECIES: fimbrial biogenesis chaperone [unclassified Luteibacter]|uniref:fimbrial biogenesis chaperone n=1 Tax=Luteibacter sp. PvP019 TaxID=3156436 RepID=UPI003397F80C
MRPWPLRVAIAGALAAMACVAHASGLQVSPIGLRLATSTAAEALWLTNTGTESLHAQVRVFRWTQADGKDVLAPSRDLVVSPPMVTIAPGDRQLVRVIRQVAPATDGMETAYRVIVDELPVDASDKPGLKFVLRYSVPVFLAPAGDPTMKAALQATWESDADGPHLRIHNGGNGHAQVADLAWQGRQGHRTPLLPGLVGYALPGATMRWKLPPDARHADGLLRARINGEPSESTLAVDTDGH